jgi:DUF971 family protein
VPGVAAAAEQRWRPLLESLPLLLLRRSNAYTDAAMSEPVATEIRLRRASRVLAVTFADGSRFELPFEYLRVHSPSAEVKGHGPGQEVLVLGKESVGITAVEPVGQYAVKLVFDDGHDTGLYTWKYLHELGREQAQKWAHYRERRAHAPAAAPAAHAGGCAHHK